MTHRTLRRFAADEDGSTATSWLYAGLLLLVLGGITQDQWMREVQGLRFHLDPAVAAFLGAD